MQGMFDPPLRNLTDIFPIVRTTNVDVDNQVTKLFRKPYAPLFYYNLPALAVEDHLVDVNYIYERENLHDYKKLSKEDNNKIFTLYKCLQEELVFYKYAVKSTESTKGNSIDTLTDSFKAETIQSGARVKKIKSDIAMTTRFMKQYYEVDGEFIESMWKVACSLMLITSNPIDQFYDAQYALYTKANVCYFVAYIFAATLVSIPTTIVELAMSRYGSAEQMGAWLAFPKWSWAMVSLNLAMVANAMTHMWLCTLPALLMSFSVLPDKFIACENVLLLLSKDANGDPLFCFDVPSNGSDIIGCEIIISGSVVSTTGYPSNWFILLVKIFLCPANLIFTLPEHMFGMFTLAITVCLWLYLLGALNTQSSQYLQTMGRGIVFYLLFFITPTLLLPIVSPKRTVYLDAISAFFTVDFNQIEILFIPLAFRSALCNQLFFTTALGSHLPRRWNFKKIILYKTFILVATSMSIMLLSYMAIFEDMHFFNVKSTACFANEYHIMISSIPRFLYKLPNGNVLILMYGMILWWMMMKSYYFQLKFALDLTKRSKYIEENYAYCIAGFCVTGFILNLGIFYLKPYYVALFIFLEDMKRMKFMVVFLSFIVFHLCIIQSYGVTRVFEDIEYLNYEGTSPRSTMKAAYYFAFISVCAVEFLSLSYSMDEFVLMHPLTQVCMILFIGFPLFIGWAKLFSPFGKTSNKEKVYTWYGIRYFSMWGTNEPSQQMRRMEFKPKYFDRITYFNQKCSNGDECLREWLPFKHSLDRDRGVKSIAKAYVDMTLRHYTL